MKETIKKQNLESFLPFKTTETIIKPQEPKINFEMKNEVVSFSEDKKNMNTVKKITQKSKYDYFNKNKENLLKSDKYVLFSNLKSIKLNNKNDNNGASKQIHQVPMNMRAFSKNFYIKNKYCISYESQ